MRVCKTLKPDREFDITRPNNVLNLEVLITQKEEKFNDIYPRIKAHKFEEWNTYLEFCWKTKLLDDASILQTAKQLFVQTTLSRLRIFR